MNFSLCTVKNSNFQYFCWMIRTQPISLLKLFLLYRLKNDFWILSRPCNHKKTQKVFYWITVKIDFWETQISTCYSLKYELSEMSILKFGEKCKCKIGIPAKCLSTLFQKTFFVHFCTYALRSLISLPYHSYPFTMAWP